MGESIWAMDLFLSLRIPTYSGKLIKLISSFPRAPNTIKSCGVIYMLTLTFCSQHTNSEHASGNYSLPDTNQWWEKQIRILHLLLHKISLLPSNPGLPKTCSIVAIAKQFSMTG